MYKGRRKKVFKSLEDNSMLLLYSGVAPKRTADQLYPYEVNRNFYYLTGIDQADSYLLMLKGNKKEEAILFLEPSNPLKAKWDGPTLSFEGSKELSQVDNVLNNDQVRNYIARLLSPTRAASFGTLKHFYFDLERMSVNEIPSVGEKFANDFQQLYPHLVIKNINPIINEMRSIKDASEVDLVKEAIDITNKGILGILENLQPGLKENQLEAYYNFVLNWHGVKPSFKTILGSGVNGTILHYSDNNSLMEDGDLVLLDLGVEFRKYCSDISRTFPVNGKFTPRQKEIYEIVLHTNKEVIKFLKPGVTTEEFNNLAKKLLAEGLMKIGKIQDESELSKYYYHSIGHFLGLDVHDVGNYTEPFKAGQILTVEPGLYLEDEKIGIRIEDNILLTKNGNINLSEKIPKEIEDIERIMAEK